MTAAVRGGSNKHYILLWLDFYVGKKGKKTLVIGASAAHCLVISSRMSSGKISESTHFGTIPREINYGIRWIVFLKFLSTMDDWLQSQIHDIIMAFSLPYAAVLLRRLSEAAFKPILVGMLARENELRSGSVVEDCVNTIRGLGVISEQWNLGHIGWEIGGGGSFWLQGSCVVPGTCLCANLVSVA